MYTAVILDHMSQRLLTWIVQATVIPEVFGYKTEAPEGYDLPHHMTINLGKFDNHLNDPSMLGSKAMLSITSVYFNHEIGICAAKVKRAVIADDNSLIHTMNDGRGKSAHITCALKDGVHPKQSNILFKDKKCKCRSFTAETLYGTITEVN